MSQPQFQIVDPADRKTIELIADWYVSEWNIPKEKTIQKLESFSGDSSQFQALMTLEGVPVSTGGLYHHVGLLDKEPRFSVYKYWLALVYTIPPKRQQGYGALLCNYIYEYAKKLGVPEIFLYTDTAERLYARMGWQVLERIRVGERNIVVMKKQLCE